MAGSRNLEEDRISSLPDEILAHILSFVPTTTQAAATSILSRRWRHLYCLTDSLIFNKSFTRHTLYTLNNIMMQRGVNPLRKFSLELDCYFSERDEDVSLEPRMFHTLQELELASEYRSLYVPLQLWNNKHLVTLKLSCPNVRMPMKHPELVCLPRLRSLHLDGIRGMESEFINMIFKNSLSLENFTLSGCSLKEPGVLRFCGKALKSLILGGYHRRGDQRPKVVIDAPSLTHFECNTNYDCKFKKLNALKEASITVIWNKYNVVLNMLYAVAEVKVLHLPGEVLEVLEKRKLMGHFFELPLFSNLSQFALDLPWACNPGSMFWEMLSRSPRLQTVTFPSGILYMERSPNQALSMSLTNLKTIEVHFFNRCKEDSFSMEHLVQNVKSLEKVILHKRHPMDVEEELQLQMSIRRSSRHCSIEFK